ncbi:MAG: tetratricopeptide repeat protein [Desulfosarcina sp.]|nr:tetratricopeptide repeat protein [Desulfosarcina sp.]
MERRHNMKPPDLHEDKDPARASGFFKKRLSMDWIIVISVFVFFGGALGGILFCGHYAHDPLASGSGSMAQTSFQGQIERLEQEARKNPSNTKAWIELGNLCFDSGRYAKAMEAYGRALECNPQDTDVRIDLGVLQRLTGRPMEAIASFDRVISQDLKNETARLYKAIVLKEDLNDREGAVRVLEKIVRMNPSAMAGPDQSVQGLVREYQAWEPSSAKQH